MEMDSVGQRPRERRHDRLQRCERRGVGLERVVCPPRRDTSGEVEQRVAIESPTVHEHFVRPDPDKAVGKVLVRLGRRQRREVGGEAPADLGHVFAQRALLRPERRRGEHILPRLEHLRRQVDCDVGQGLGAVTPEQRDEGLDAAPAQVPEVLARDAEVVVAFRPPNRDDHEPARGVSGGRVRQRQDRDAIDRGAPEAAGVVNEGGRGSPVSAQQRERTAAEVAGAEKDDRHLGLRLQLGPQGMFSAARHIDRLLEQHAEICHQCFVRDSYSTWPDGGHSPRSMISRFRSLLVA